MIQNLLIVCPNHFLFPTFPLASLPITTQQLKKSSPPLLFHTHDLHERLAQPRTEVRLVKPPLQGHITSMSKCFSFTATIECCLRSCFSRSGLRSTITDLGDGTIMHCWVPKTRKETQPNLLLLHGIGANAKWQWANLIRRVAPYFNVYVPDLVFFGDSYSTRPDRSDSFQAECVMRVMESNSVKNMRVVGLSYGGFVAYMMAAMYKEAVERVAICGAGVCMEEKDLREGLFPVEGVEEAAEILLMQTADRIRELMRYSFVNPPMWIPSCFLNDFIDVSFHHFSIATV